MTWTVITVMATVSISFFHSEFGTDISSLFSERKKQNVRCTFVHGKGSIANGTRFFYA